MCGALGALVTVSVLVGCGSSSTPTGTPPPGQPSSGGATDLTDEVSSIRQTLQSGVDAGVFPGAVVVVRLGGQSRTVAVGQANVGTGATMTAADRFQVASMTKSMVAAVTMELVEQGTLSLSDTVEQWEPGLLPRGADITVGDLLGQTSGLPDYTPTVVTHYVSGKTPTNPRALVGLVAHRPLMFPPGSRSFYSNTNYIVLGMILQTVTHQTLTRLLQHQLFGPLGLRSASLDPKRTLTPPVAHGYDHGKDETNPELTWLWAAGGVVANMVDVARFYDDLLSGKVVRAPLLGQMLAMRKETNHELPFSGYGLGVATIPTQCGPAYGHSGSVLGFIAHAWSTRNDKRSVVLAINASITPSVNDYIVDVLNQALCGPS
jgi:D-alanyl-D-alanine carboxypeptidase